MGRICGAVDMKMYMGYDDAAGSGEGAVLVFANDAKEAKNMAWEELQGWNFDTEYIDVRAKWLKESEYLRPFAESKGPHVVNNPPTCDNCEMWGISELDKHGICSDCTQDAAKREEL